MYVRMKRLFDFDQKALEGRAYVTRPFNVALAIKRYENDAKRIPAEQKLFREAAHLLQITM